MKATIDELKVLLEHGVTTFMYTKVDGTPRSAHGTLKSDLIPEAMWPMDNSTYKANNLRYFDIDKNEWRSISGTTTEVTVL